MLDDLFRPEVPGSAVTARAAYRAAGAYACFVVVRLAAWNHTGVVLHWLMVAVGAVLTIWQWRAYLAAWKVDPSFGGKNSLTTFLNIPLILGSVMTVGDTLTLARQTF